MSRQLRAAESRYHELHPSTVAGIPCLIGVVDLYAQMRFLAPDILGYSSFYSFSRNHLEYHPDYPGMIVAAHNTEWLAAKIAPFVYQVTKEEAGLDLPASAVAFHSSNGWDIHGGKTIILGPKNYLGRQWQGSPISITVEGANILTRNMIIFGQGAVRCHPYVLKLMQAATVADPQRRISEFDHVLFKHVGFAVSNACRAFLYGLTHSRIGSAPGDTYTKRYYRKLSRYSAALALVADTSMLLLGGKLKQKERISARLGDVLSYLYIASSMLKRFEDQGRPELDRPFLAWAFHECIYRIQAALDGVLRNFPARPAAWLLRALVFPIGRLEAMPGDRLGRRVATLLMYPNEARDRLGEFCYLTPTANNPAGQMNSVLASIIEAEPIERKLAKAVKAGTLTTPDAAAQLAEAVQYNVITEVERDLLTRTRAATAEIIAVDDFDTADLVAGRRADSGARANLRSAA